MFRYEKNKISKETAGYLEPCLIINFEIHDKIEGINLLKTQHYFSELQI